MADALKAEGVKLFNAKDFNGAIDKWSQAIELDPRNHVLYSNRSGAYTSIKDWEKALQDADRTVEIKPDWPKGWNRKAAAMHGSGDHPEAYKAYGEALKLDPTNSQAISGRAELERLEQERNNSLVGALRSSNLTQYLAQDPKTSKLLANPAFMAKLHKLQNNPDNEEVVKALQTDPELIALLPAIFSIAHAGASTPSVPDVPMSASGSTPNPSSAPKQDATKPNIKSEPKPEPKPEPEPEPEPEDEETIARRKADEEKKLGTENYKKREFDAAIEHYTKAWELHKDVTYLTNLGAAHFEKGDFDATIEVCQKAVEEGRDMRADFKLIAKAFGRIGSAYEKKGDWPNAILNYERSLTEFRTPDVSTKLRAAQKSKIQEEKDAYLSPEKAEEAREAGNGKFKEGDWPGAMELYSEMIKRAPNDLRGYTNRAQCFIKLLSFPSAIQDCDEALKKDPKFIRAYLRKAAALFGLRRYSKCINVCEQATVHDEDQKNTREIFNQISEAVGARSRRQATYSKETMGERFKKNPELEMVYKDNEVQHVLNALMGEQDPAARNKALEFYLQSNPGLRSKLDDLDDGLIIRIHG